MGAALAPGERCRKCAAAPPVERRSRGSRARIDTCAGLSVRQCVGAPHSGGKEGGRRSEDGLMAGGDAGVRRSCATTQRHESCRRHYATPRDHHPHTCPPARLHARTPARPHAPTHPFTHARIHAHMHPRTHAPERKDGDDETNRVGALLLLVHASHQWYHLQAARAPCRESTVLSYRARLARPHNPRSRHHRARNRTRIGGPLVRGAPAPPRCASRGCRGCARAPRASSRCPPSFPRPPRQLPAPRTSAPCRFLCLENCQVTLTNTHGPTKSKSPFGLRSGGDARRSRHGRHSEPGGWGGGRGEARPEPGGGAWAGRGRGQADRGSRRHAVGYFRSSTSCKALEKN